ncbi:MAG: NRAMP family divalent metal transporter [Candidatus Bathyarchaeia archaeon]
MIPETFRGKEIEVTLAMLGERNISDVARAFGPAWLVMIADVDAASVVTAAETGAIFHYGLIWLLIVLTVPLFFIQEASGRIGAVTHKGLGEIVRENYSRNVALVAAVPMALTDVLTYIAEYLGIALGLGLLGIPVVVSVIVTYVLHVVLVYKRKYAVVEKVMLGMSAVLLLSYFASLVMRGAMSYSPFYISSSPMFLFIVAANAGAVVMPFMPFYQASATAEKKLATVSSSRAETLLGAVVSEVLMVIIVMVSSGFDHGLDFFTEQQLSLGLVNIAGRYAPLLFGIGLFAASFLALVVISLGSAWGVVEAIGWHRNRAFVIYFLESIPAVIVTLMLSGNLLTSILNLMVAFVFVLIAPAVMMGRIASNPRIMGAHASNGVWKIAYWLSLIFVVILGVISVVSSIV